MVISRIGMNEDKTNNAPEADDAELMMQAAAGDMTAFERIVSRHQAKLLNFFVRMGVNKDKAEDMVQDTFINLFKSRQRYQQYARFTTYLYSIARNVRTDHLRKQIREECYRSKQEPFLERLSDGGMRRTFARMDIVNGVAVLSEKLREPLVLSVFMGLKYDEIAEILGIPVGTVKSRIFLAMTELRRRLQ